MRAEDFFSVAEIPAGNAHHCEISANPVILELLIDATLPQFPGPDLAAPGPPREPDEAAR